MDWPSFIYGDYRSQSPTADQEHTVNMYVEKTEAPGATTRAALYPTPGVEEIWDRLSGGPGTGGSGRAHFYGSGREFVVIGAELCEIASNGTAVIHGAMAIGESPATICSNGDGGGQLLITTGNEGYIFDLATNILANIGALSGIATMGDFLDGYFLILDANASKFYISDLLDGTVWDPTQSAQRSIASDKWVSMRVVGRYVWLLGEESSEVWYNAGSSPFPFAPHPSGLIPYGIAAPFSVAVADGTIIWLGASKIGDAYVLRAAGFSPEIVSDYPLQFAFNNYLKIDDAVADTYNDLGHAFYLLTFPSQGITWALDLGTRQWAQRGTWISEENKYTAWRPRWHAMAFGEHRMLDSQAGKVYRMSSALTSDADDRPKRWLRRAPCLFSENERIFFSYFELFMEVGIGTATGQGSDPQVMIRLSKDGGRTWGSEQLRSVGKIGEYLRRVRIERVGMARKLVVEVSGTDPIQWRLTGAGIGLAQQVQAQQQRSA